MKRRPTQPEPLPIERMPAYRPSRRELAAIGRLHEQWHHPRQHQGLDPLELRLAWQAILKRNRPGFVVSNPLHHQLLLRLPDLDDSQPGPAWMFKVYRRHWDLLTLPRARAVLQARNDAIEAQIRRDRQPTPPPAAPQPVQPQQELFA